jgi:hypothetical protein
MYLFELDQFVIQINFHLEEKERSIPDRMIVDLKAPCLIHFENRQ